jgi:hypothetical protein
MINNFLPDKGRSADGPDDIEADQRIKPAEPETPATAPGSAFGAGCERDQPDLIIEPLQGVLDLS